MLDHITGLPFWLPTVIDRIPPTGIHATSDVNITCHTTFTSIDTSCTLLHPCTSQATSTCHVTMKFKIHRRVNMMFEQLCAKLLRFTLYDAYFMRCLTDAMEYRMPRRGGWNVKIPTATPLVWLREPSRHSYVRSASLDSCIILLSRIRLHSA